jgi:hypothetical protein
MMKTELCDISRGCSKEIENPDSVNFSAAAARHIRDLPALRGSPGLTEGKQWHLEHNKTRVPVRLLRR